jgi:hypothetical protein
MWPIEKENEPQSLTDSERPNRLTESFSEFQSVKRLDLSSSAALLE